MKTDSRLSAYCHGNGFSECMEAKPLYTRGQQCVLKQLAEVEDLMGSYEIGLDGQGCIMCIAMKCKSMLLYLYSTKKISVIPSQHELRLFVVS